MCPGVRIGFELTEYEVVEDEDSVMMVVEVLEGELSGPVEIDLATEDFTATSTCKLKLIIED